MLEAALRVDDALAGGRQGGPVQDLHQDLAQKRGRMATFMAKWSRDWPGQPAICTRRFAISRAARRAFYDAKAPAQHVRHHALVRRWAAAADARDSRHGGVHGEQLHAPDPRLLGADGSAWGVENRTTALRVIPGRKSQRVEYRVAAADINPYIALAAAIGTGLWGIENKIEPGDRSRAMPTRSNIRRSGRCRGPSEKRQGV